ncbi:MAG: hypothetical protein V3T72_23560 [Thermoanaerobaculia bacterium]
MRTLKTLKPGQKGTNELLAGYGPSLLRARGSPKLGGQTGGDAPQNVALRIGWRERDLRWRVKSAGGQWDPGRRVRMLRRDMAKRLDLLHRVVGGGA